MHSTIGIDIAAPPELVYRLARDVTRWERLLPHYARSRVVRREADGALVCDFVARRSSSRGSGRAAGRLAQPDLARAGDAAGCGSSTWPARRRAWT